MSVTDELLEIYARRGAEAYFGEAVTMMDHGLQAAYFARARSAPAAERKAPQSAFDFKTKLAVEPNSRLIVAIDVQFDAFEVEPVVSKVERSLHQGRTDAFALPVVAHRHADPGGVAKSRQIGMRVQTHYTDGLGRVTGQQPNLAALRFAEALAPEFR